MGIEGVWYSELGSRLVIDEVADGAFTGRFHTAVSAGNCATGEFAVVGTTDVDHRGQTLSFAVTWRNAESNCHSSTGWTGQYQTFDGIEHLVTIWLTNWQTAPEDDWNSTIVGENVFTRASPDAQAIAEAATRRRHPHP